MQNIPRNEQMGVVLYACQTYHLCSRMSRCRRRLSDRTRKRGFSARSLGRELSAARRSVHLEPRRASGARRRRRIGSGVGASAGGVVIVRNWSHWCPWRGRVLLPSSRDVRVEFLVVGIKVSTFITPILLPVRRQWRCRIWCGGVVDGSDGRGCSGIRHKRGSRRYRHRRNRCSTWVDGGRIILLLFVVWVKLASFVIPIAGEFLPVHRGRRRRWCCRVRHIIRERDGVVGDDGRR